MAPRLRSNRRALARSGSAVVVAVAGLVALAASGACTSSTTTLPYTPITGIIIRSQSLVAGYGCGTADGGPGQVYRYAAVLTYAPADGGADASASLTLTNVFDCFADGVFENLPTTGGSTFELTIYAYTAAAYADARLPVSLGCSPGQPPDAAFCAQGSSAMTAAEVAAATWTTRCTGTQQAGAPVLASCDPLEPVAAPGSPTPDASMDAPADAATEASAPASSNDASGDGPEGAPADAGADSGPNDAATSGG
jgi:hypothetical protein